MDKKLYIVDGHSHLFAAYYAIRNLTSPSGEPTNAVYGMTSVLLKILRDHDPDYLLTVFDPPGKTFRNEIYPDYKANRPAMDESLAVQVDRVQEVLGAMGIPVLIVENYEADDLIATITEQAKQSGIDVTICSKDKDLQQLINDKVRLYDSTKEKYTDTKELKVDKGIKPEQVPDMLALMGDSVDNVPGIPGVGPKTAAKLIQQFGSLEDIINNIDKVSPKIREYLSDAENCEKIRLSRRLVTLAKDAPVEFRPEEWQVEITESDNLRKLFSELGFTRFLQQLGFNSGEGQGKDGDKGASEDVEFVQVRDLDQLSVIAGEVIKSEYLSFDTETTSMDPMQGKLIGVSFCCGRDKAYYVPLRSVDGQHLEWDGAVEIIKGFLGNEEIKKVGQNLKYDITVLKNAGIDVKNVAFDTMIAAYLLDPVRSSYGLDNLAEEYLGYKTTKITELIGKGRNQLTLDQVPTEGVSEYACEDAYVAWRLFEVFRDKLEGAELLKLFGEVEMPLVGVLATMEMTGVEIDTEGLGRLSNELADQLKDLTRSIYEACGETFNIDSPKQLSEVLFDKLNLPAVKMTKTGRSTDISVLESLSDQHEVPKLILEYRQLAKLKSTYVDRLPEMINERTGRIHASFNQTGTATGRLSSSEPNLQNIPIRSEFGRRIREAFVPGDREKEVILACDYSQVELRLLAHFSGDENLVRAFREDLDIHAFVAGQIFDVDINLVNDDQRRVAKTVNFGLMYGQTAFGLAKTLGIRRREAQQFIDAYFEKYSGVKEFIGEVIEQTRTRGYALTILGRHRPVPELESRNPAQRSFGQRMAFNTVVQGSAADLIKVAMINIQKAIEGGRINAKMLIQVHDELVFETAKRGIEMTTDRIVDFMSGAIKLDVPLKVDVAWGKSWLEEK